MKKVILMLSVVLSLNLVAADGADLFKKCTGCHGTTGTKKALGKSKIIANFSEKELTTALHGYKNGTYGGAMKGLMKGQVVRMSTEDITTLSKYIVQLNK